VGGLHFGLRPAQLHEHQGSLVARSGSQE
jgi:hypothetical protein